MKLTVSDETSERHTATRRLWGVSLRKEKRSLKPNSEELAHWGEPFENVRHPYYSVKMHLLGKGWHVGVRSLPKKAGELYDSALFHLWGFMKSPRVRFNYLRPEDPAPVELPEVKQLRERLRQVCQTRGLDFEAFNFSFADRNS